FIRANSQALEKIASATQGLVSIVGFAHLDGDLYNAAAVCADGAVKGVYHKHFLPTYGVFDEDRYFMRGRDALVFEIAGVNIGVDAVARERLHDPRMRKVARPPADVRRGDILISGEQAPRDRMAAASAPALDTTAAVYGALVCGVRDYVRKNGFREVFIALSGGIDSALTAAIAVDALGADAVTGVLMSSKY